MNYYYGQILTSVQVAFIACHFITSCAQPGLVTHEQPSVKRILNKLSMVHVDNAGWTVLPRVAHLNKHLAKRK